MPAPFETKGVFGTMTDRAPQDQGRMPMSPEFQATLMRARDYAFDQGHAHVVVEHLLLSLTEDGDATAVMQACNLDLSRLRNDVAGFLGSNSDIPRATPGAQPVIAQQLTQILSYATIAARQGRRERVDGAIVLAALIGEGRSLGAGFLKAQGLTFEAAVQVLQRGIAPVQTARAEPAPSVDAPSEGGGGARPAQPLSGTDHILNRARERVEARTGGRLRAEPPAETRPAPPAAPEPASSDARPPEAPISPEAQPTLAQPPARPLPPVGPGTEAPAGIAAAASMASPSSEASVSAGPPPPLQHAMPQPGRVDAESLRDALSRARPDAPIEQPDHRAVEPQGEPVLPMPPSMSPPQSVPPRGPAPVAAPAEPPQQGSGWSPPPLPAPGSFRPAAPPAPPARGGEAGVTPGPQPMPGTGMAPRGARPPMGDAMRGAEPVQGRGPSMLSSAPPAGRHELGAPGGAPPPPPQRRGPPPPGPVPVGHAPPVSVSQPPPRVDPPRRGPPIDAARVTPIFPARLRAGRASVVEVRVGRMPVSGLGRTPTPEAFRPDLVAARVVTARLRSAHPDVTVEPSSPETQWDFPSSTTGRLTSDEAIWRFTVMPRAAGRSDLTLSISARTLGADGVIADMTLPDQQVAIPVGRDHRQVVRRVAAAVALVVGTVILTKTAEVLLGVDLARAVRRVAGL